MKKKTKFFFQPVTDIFYTKKFPLLFIAIIALLSANATNYAEAISRQGANTFTTRVWWDKP